MGQVNFFMTAEDESNFLDYLFSRTDTHVLEGRSFQLHNPMPLASKKDIGKSKDLTLVNNELEPEPSPGQGTPGNYHFELYRDRQIEFSRCWTANERLVSGRVFATTGALATEKEKAIHRKWYGAIERWLKKYYRRVNKWWWFAPGAWEWSMDGGICCYGTVGAYAVSLARAENSWFESKSSGPMSVNELHVFVYPNLGPWRSDAIANPTWQQIEEAIRQLDRHDYPFLKLFLTQPRAKTDIRSLQITGGNGEFGILTFDSKCHQVQWFCDHSRPDGPNSVPIWTSDQGATFSERNLCNDLETVLRVAKNFAELGRLDPEVSWENWPSAPHCPQASANK